MVSNNIKDPPDSVHFLDNENHSVSLDTDLP